MNRQMSLVSLLSLAFTALALPAADALAQDQAPGNGKAKDAKAKTSSQPKLIPPPPPSVPTYADMAFPGFAGPMSFLSENIAYMSEADLQALKQKTSLDLEKSRRKVDEMILSTQEKEQRAVSFEGLYLEGVVSRRELESARTESERIKQDLEDLKENLHLLEQKWARIEKRLSELSAKVNKKPSK